MDGMAGRREIKTDERTEKVERDSLRHRERDSWRERGRDGEVERERAINGAGVGVKSL